MQPSCFVTDGKGELMQTSKNHFEAKVIFNDETIRRMFRTEFYTYEGMQRLGWRGGGLAAGRSTGWPWHSRW